MSFVFQWPRFSDEFHRDARAMLEAALNKGNKPPIIADKIEVIELEMGTQPPELQIREIGDLNLDQFRGIFRLSYAGDAHIVLRTRVQANPLNHKKPDIHTIGGSYGMLAAHQPLVVPMLLRLSHFVLNGYVVLVISKQKGITIVFKTDPLQNVDVNSTFDSIAVIQNYIQCEIEGQLREMFREDLPAIIHRLSQRWVVGKTKVEAPYLPKQSRPRPVSEYQDLSAPDTSPASLRYATSLSGLHSNPKPSLSHKPSIQRMVTQAPRSAPSAIGDYGQDRSHASTPSPAYEPPTTFPDIENYDPTYGLRPDDLPAKSGYSGFGRLFGAPRGLADLTEDPVDESTVTKWNAVDSFDVVDWEDTVSFTPPPSIASEDPPEYETIPAVGGGTVTRPRVYHSQSNIRSPVLLVSTPTTLLSHQPPHSGNGRWDLGRPTGVITPSHIQNAFFPSWLNRPGTRRGQSISGLTRSMMSSLSAGSGPGINMPLLRSSQRSKSSDNGFLPSSFRSAGLYTDRMGTQQHSINSLSDEQEEFPVDGMRLAPSLDIRRRSLSTSTFYSLDGTRGSTSNFRTNMDTDGNIVLRPGVNNTISQLSTLSHSNHTLSPYTRSLEHFTVRSVPYRTGPHLGADRQPTKARRKRTYHLGSSNKPPDPSPEVSDPGQSPRSPPLPLEFEVSDVEHYFRGPHTNLRGRTSYQTL